MKRTCAASHAAPVLAFCVLACVGTVLADPPTPPARQTNNTFEAIGNGLYLSADNGGFTLQDGNNLTVAVFSQDGDAIDLGDNYSVDVSSINGLTTDQLVFGGGRLGDLHVQLVEIDCAHRTYAVMDTRRPFDDLAWRTAETLPELLPVFTRLCPRHSS